MALKLEDGEKDIPQIQTQNLRKTPRRSLDPSENGRMRKSMRSSLKPTPEYGVAKRRSIDSSMDTENGGDGLSAQRRRRRYKYCGVWDRVGEDGLEVWWKGLYFVPPQERLWCRLENYLKGSAFSRWTDGSHKNSIMITNMCVLLYVQRWITAISSNKTTKLRGSYKFAIPFCCLIWGYCQNPVIDTKKDTCFVAWFSGEIKYREWCNHVQVNG